MSLNNTGNTKYYHNNKRNRGNPETVMFKELTKWHFSLLYFLYNFPQQSSLKKFVSVFRIKTIIHKQICQIKNTALSSGIFL